MRLSFAILISFLLPSISFAIVDMRNANYSETFVDIQAPSSGYDLKVQRTYNSRTVHNGLFGFGWCSDFETQMFITAENYVKVQECGAGRQIEYKAGSDDKALINKIVAQIMSEVKKRNADKDDRYFKALESQIREDSDLRDEFTRQLSISGNVSKGAKYLADGRTNDYIVFTGSAYQRSLPNGTTQTFDKEGHLLELRDSSGNYLKFTRSGDKMIKLTDNTGAALQFKYAPGSKYVSEIIGPRGVKASYNYAGEKLVAVNNGWGNVYKFQYDELYNLTRADYPDKTYIALNYNKDKDWVTGFRDRQGCTESYAYKGGDKSTDNYYSSAVEKKCDGKTTNKSSYEFWHNTAKGGERYLAKTKAVINGQETLTEYHPVHGRPTLMKNGTFTTKYSYYKSGLLKGKYEPNRDMLYKYNTKCQKPSEVLTKVTVREPAKNNSKKMVSKVNSITTKFYYNKRTCNLDAARNSEGFYAKLAYDRQGRISKIIDQSKKSVLIQYDSRTGKPSVVTRPGLGSIKFKYKPDGQLDKIDSDDEPLVAVQVGNMFSNLLDIIAPGTTGSPI